MKMICGTVPRARLSSINAKLRFKKHRVSKLNIFLSPRCSKGYSEQFSRYFPVMVCNEDGMRYRAESKIGFHQCKIRVRKAQGV